MTSSAKFSDFLTPPPCLHFHATSLTKLKFEITSTFFPLLSQCHLFPLKKVTTCEMFADLHQRRLRHPEEREGSEARQGQPDRPAAALHGEGPRGGERGDRAAAHLPRPGGHHQDPQDAEAHLQRPAAQRAHRHPQEHVPAVEEDGEGADRVAHRAQVHEEGRGQHQHVHLHGVGGIRIKEERLRELSHHPLKCQPLLFLTFTSLNGVTDAKPIANRKFSLVKLKTRGCGRVYCNKLIYSGLCMEDYRFLQARSEY